MSGSPSHAYESVHAEASSSRSPSRQPTVEEVDENDTELLSTDPLNDDLAAGYGFDFPFNEKLTRLPQDILQAQSQKADLLPSQYLLQTNLL